MNIELTRHEEAFLLQAARTVPERYTDEFFQEVADRVRHGRLLKDAVDVAMHLYRVAS